MHRLEGEEVVVGIEVGGFLVADEFAEVKEMLLVDLALGRGGNLTPLIDEFMRGHAWVPFRALRDGVDWLPSL